MAGKTAHKNDYKEALLDAGLLTAANLLDQAGKIDQALGIYNTILKNNPNSVGALIGRATVSLLDLEDDKAMKDLHKACALARQDRSALRMRGLAHLIAGNFEAANKDFQKQFESGDWDSLVVLFAFALLYKKSGKELARSFLSEAISKDKIKNKEWPYPNLQLIKGDITMTTLMGLAFSKSKQLEVRAYSGFWKVFSDNPPEAKADLQFIEATESASAFCRMLAVRGLKIVDEGLVEKYQQKADRADRIADVDFLG